MTSANPWRPLNRQWISRLPSPVCGGDAWGDWKQAHERAQEDECPDASWVHAYLHRKEGDQKNAAYWYRRAGKPDCREPFDAEWRRIVIGLME